MKYCPNLDCAYLELTGQIAEYQDNIDFCPDCDTELESGAAPFVLPRGGTEAGNDAPLFPDDLSTVSAVDAYEDALWLKDELEKVGIPAVIRVTGDGDDGDDGDDAIPSFEIKVMGRHMLPALNLVQTLLDEERDDLDNWEDNANADAADNGLDKESDTLWEGDSFYNEDLTPRFITNPLVVLLSLFCALLAIGYLLLVGFPGS